MDHGASEFGGFENFGGHYDVINGGQTKKSFFFDQRLRLQLMLDGYSTDFRTEKRFQENGHLRVVCHHLGCDTAPGGFVRGAQKWGRILAHGFLCANSVLRRAKRLRHVKNRRKTMFFTYSNFNLQFISKTRGITSHSFSEAVMKVP